jgi:hypothetical protein
MLGDLPGNSGRRPASTGRNSDTGPPGFVLPLLREKLKKVTGRIEWISQKGYKGQ